MAWKSAARTRGWCAVAAIVALAASACGSSSDTQFTSHNDGGPDGSAASGGTGGGASGSGGTSGTAGTSGTGGTSGSAGASGTAGTAGGGGSAGAAAGAAGAAGADAGSVCGNSQVEAGEDCDDGAQNGVTGSGCDATCHFECNQDSDCTDNNACNGAETCATVSGGKTCQPGTAVASVSCYSGAAADLTAANTACKAGTQYCVNGAAGACIGEVLPTAESCNGIDDDCNGSVDDGLGTISCGVGACATTAPACVSGAPGTCTPKAAASAETCGNGIDDNCNGLVDEGCGCVAVAPNGDDTTGTGAQSAPFKTIAKAIAAAGTGGLPMQVCVASGATCPSVATYQEAITMRDGVSVYGGYQSTSWTRGNSCQTEIEDQSHNGLYFPPGVTTTTILDGFLVTGTDMSTNAAITVDGSTGAVISNDLVRAGDGTSSNGIMVQDNGGTAATPVIRNCAVTGGNGSASAIGVHVVNSAPVMTGNCDLFDSAGRCIQWGCWNATRFIRGRSAGNTGNAGSETYAVRLESSPNTVIDTSAVCSSDGQGDIAGVRISGDATGVVIRRNHVDAPGGQVGNVNSVGVWMDACNGASPWIVDNTRISAQSRTTGGRADGVRAVGDCNPRIDTNQRIVGGEESANNDAIGVYCAADVATNKASRCTVLGNILIQGASAGFPPTAAGVRCDAGACVRIEGNVITGNQGVNTFGVILNGAATFVSNNVISAGCTRGVGIGVESVDSLARVQNNVIRGGEACTNGTPTSTYGVLALLSDSGNELDLHSNDIFGAGAAASGGTPCTSRALTFDVTVGGAPPTAGLGVIRNNILDAGTCPTRYGVLEALASTDPRIFENNDLWPASPTALYRDEGTTDLSTAAAVNALTDMTVSGVISADPLFTSATNYHLTATSPCVDTGTNANAPTTDWEGDARPQGATCDIGADEYVP